MARPLRIEFAGALYHVHRDDATAAGHDITLRAKQSSPLAANGGEDRGEGAIQTGNLTVVGSDIRQAATSASKPITTSPCAPRKTAPAKPAPTAAQATASASASPSAGRATASPSTLPPAARAAMPTAAT